MLLPLDDVGENIALGCPVVAFVCMFVRSVHCVKVVDKAKNYGHLRLLSLVVNV